MDLEGLREIKEIMTPIPHIAKAEDRLSVAVAVMDQHRIRHLPVIKEGEIFGILSDRDCKLALYVAERFDITEPLMIGEVCSQNPYIVAPKTKLEDVTLAMYERRISSALVAEDGAMLGIFTSMDACRWIGTWLRNKG